MEKLAGFNRVAGFDANGCFLLAKDINIFGKSLASLPARDAVVLSALAVLVAPKSQSNPISKLATALPQTLTASYRLKEFASERCNGMLDMLKDNPSLLLSIAALETQLHNVYKMLG